MMKRLSDKYHNGQLPNDDLSKEEVRLLEKMLDQQKARKWSKQLEKQGISRIETTQKNKGSNTIIRMLRPIASIAAVLLVTFGCWKFMFTGNSAEYLANEYLTSKFELMEGAVRGEDNSEITKAKAAQAYDSGDFATTIKHLQKLVNLEKASNVEFFMMGLCYLYIEKPQPEEAIKYLQKAKNIDATKYKDEINFHLGISYILIKDNPKAKAFLTKVVESSSSRKKQIDQAKEMLRKLD